MGLLMNLLGLSPEQTQGLLGFSSALAKSSGPSPFPKSSGLSDALQAYQQGKQAYQDHDLLQQMSALRLKAMQGEVTDQEKARQDALAAQDWMRKYNLGGTPGAAAPTFPAPQPASQMFQGMMNGAPPQQPAASDDTSATGAPRQNATMNLFTRRMKQAEDMRASGLPPLMAQADALEKSALAFQPKVKDWKEVQQGGKVLYAPYFEDGSTGAPVPLEVAQKLEFQNVGGKTLGLNPTTGAQVTSYDNTMSPGEVASNALGLANLRLGRDRLSFEKDNSNKPVFNADAGGWITPPSDTNPTGQLLPVAGVTGKPPTEFQGKSAAYGLRATEADKILTGLQGKYSPAAINAKAQVSDWPLIGGVTGAVTNKFAMSPMDQQAEQGQRDFVNAVLRQESGAAIAPSEFDNARKQYFPQPGDSQQVIAQKARNRQLAIQGLQANAGKAGLTAPPVAAPATKTVTLSDIAATAKASGKTTKQVTADLRAAGYTIGGQ